MNVRRCLAWGLLTAGAVALVAQPYRSMVVSGGSMAPTYANGEMLLTLPLDRPLRRGDGVVAETDSGPVVKRVALLEGDRRLQWQTPHSSEWIDTTTVREPRSALGRSRLRSIAVPEGTVFLLGDNLDSSVDSRSYGPVPVSRIGRIVVDLREPSEDSTAAAEIVRRWVMRGITRFRPERLTASLRTYSLRPGW